MNLDAALEEASNLTPPVLSSWLGLEAQRDAAQWQPQRAEKASSRSQEEEAGGQEGEEGGGAGEAGRVRFRDVAPLLLTLGEPPVARPLAAGGAHTGRHGCSLSGQPWCCLEAWGWAAGLAGACACPGACVYLVLLRVQRVAPRVVHKYSVAALTGGSQP
jgi:hypothetical protein